MLNVTGTIKEVNVLGAMTTNLEQSAAVPTPDTSTDNIARGVEDVTDTVVHALASCADILALPRQNRKQANIQRRQVLQKLVDECRAKKVVCLGESTHGTKEFYDMRAELTQMLLEDTTDFQIVLAEASWPDAYRINQYIGTQGSIDSNAESASSAFTDFPMWMWRNKSMVEFWEWLKQKNTDQASNSKFIGGCGSGLLCSNDTDIKFYGMDLYSLFTSQSKLIDFLEIYDPELATVASAR